MKKYLLRWVFLGVGLLLTITLFFIFKVKKTNTVCTDFNIEYHRKQEPLISKSQIADYLRKDSIQFIGLQGKDIDLASVEKSLNKNDFIQEAHCYLAMNGNLQLVIHQKTPILRVIPLGKPGYYLDKNGKKFPLSLLYTPDVKVATGFINTSLHKKLYTFTSYVNQSDFWKPFIEQIFVRPNGDIIFTTQMGGHEVVVGDNNRLEQKLDKLMRFYQKASSNLGWETYREINIKYRDQVICKK